MWISLENAVLQSCNFAHNPKPTAMLISRKQGLTSVLCHAWYILDTQYMNVCESH